MDDRTSVWIHFPDGSESIMPDGTKWQQWYNSELAKKGYAKNTWRCKSRHIGGELCTFDCLVSSEFEPSGCLRAAIYQQWELVDGREQGQKSDN